LRPSSLPGTLVHRSNYERDAHPVQVRTDAIGSFCTNPKTRTFAELLIDCEEDRTLRAVLVGDVAGDRALARSGGSEGKRRTASPAI
jgi:hypothetical protein